MDEKNESVYLCTKVFDKWEATLTLIYHSSNNEFLEREKANFKHALAQPPCKHAKVQVRTILESVSVHARPYKARKI